MVVSRGITNAFTLKKTMTENLKVLLYQYLTHGLTYDVEHYLQRAQKNIADAPQHGKKILELGVGLGRTLIPMLKLGAECYGIDSDRAMLAVARSAAGEDAPINLRLGKIESFLQPHQFSQIQVPLRTFQLLTIEKQGSLLQCAAEHLSPNGELLIHLSAPPIVKIDGSWRIYRESPVADGGIMVIEEALFKNNLSSSFFKEQCTIELRHRFQQFDATGFSTGVWRLAHSLLSWTPQMFSKFAKSHGLKEHAQIQLSEGDWISCCGLS